ncbi:MAG: type II secretion system F family protein [Campylobacterota bacterium]|nr:type II secretion system F family protein [Campylobacterota bacterium]
MWLLILSPVIIVSFVILSIYLLKKKKRHKFIIMLSKLDIATIVSQQKRSADEDVKELQQKLIQAGITFKEYNEAKILFIVIGFIVGISIPVLFPGLFGYLAIFIGIICVFFGGQIYLMIAKAERVEKIEKDLGTFLDLVNVILEAGGSLKNSFFTVSTKGKNIIDDELLKEIAILEYEMTNYSTKQAYENLKQRVDSEEVAKIVDFLVLSEETGIGVKNIFTTQSAEMRQDKFYKVKGKVNTLNMYLMIVVFVFILPAVGAFVVFPMQSGAIATGF